MRPRRSSSALLAVTLLAAPAFAQEVVVKGRPCLFLHGVGGDSAPGTFSPKQPTRVLPDGTVVSYWGHLESELAGLCGSFTYSNQNTHGADWRDPKLQDSYYDTALDVVNRGGVVFAHSMGNTILGGACMTQGKCGVKWYGLGNPIRGSAAAALAETRSLPFGDYTPPSLDPRVPGLGDSGLARVVAGKGLLKGAMCGTSAQGSGGMAGAALIQSTSLAYGPSSARLGYPFIGICHGWKNCEDDGLVHEDECARYEAFSPDGTTSVVDLGPFDTTPASPFFLAPANHWDLTGSTDAPPASVYDWMRAMAGRD
jgi:hypothetical protein